VDAVSAYVRAHVTYLPGATSVEATAQEAWDLGEGVCQDLTHVTIGLLRELGIPARYVSCYLFPLSDAEVGEVVAGQSHAWIEYFSGAWTGMDPTTAFPRPSATSSWATVETTTTWHLSRVSTRVRPLPVWASSWR